MILILPALAKPAPATLCVAQGFEHTAPADGTTGVPGDLAPLILWDRSCPPVAPIRLLLTDGDGSPIYDASFDELVRAPDHVFLEPEWGILTPDTTFVLEYHEFDFTYPAIGFTTGSDTVVPIDGRPAVSVIAASVEHRYEREVSAQLLLTAAGGTGRTLFVVSSGGVEVASAYVSDGAVVDVEWIDTTPSDEVCVTIEQRDPTGAWLGPSEPACATAIVTGGVDTRCGCDHSAPWWHLSAFLPLLAFRRRR